MIELKNVEYIYPNGVKAIRDVSVQLDSKVSIFIGPNGSGKTTLMKLISLIYEPTEGELLIDNINPWLLNKSKFFELRKNIVYVHENPILLKGTVLDNLKFPLLLRGVPDKEASSIAENFLVEYGLEKLKNRKRKELSAGEAQLVTLLRAIIIEPKYLLLDEPTNNLDPEKTKLVIDLINNLKKKVEALIISTHDRLLPIEIGGRIYVVNEGKIIESKNARDLAIELENLIKNIKK